MKRLIVIILLAILGIFVVSAIAFNLPSDVSLSSAPTPTPVTLDAYKIYNLINDYRSSKGLNKLTFDQSMCDYSNLRLSEIHSDWSHQGFYKNRPAWSLRPDSYAGENLITGETTEKNSVASWINSPEHLKNILDTHFSRTCIVSDSYKDATYAVQEFASY